MNMTVRKAEAVQAVPIKQAAEVVRLKRPKSSLADGRLVAGLSAVAARVESIVFSSTAAVYGNPSKVPVAV